MHVHFTLQIQLNQLQLNYNGFSVRVLGSTQWF